MSPTASPDVRTGLIVRDTGNPIPLEHVRVESRVTDFSARVTVHQSYRNREGVPLEVVYVFPLDEGAAVCGFEADVDGVRYVGQVLERDGAFRKYDDALEAGHGGFLLDEERADVFTASLGNVTPGSAVTLSITYVTELAAEGAAARFTLPTTVSPRYAPEPDRAGVGPTPADVLNPPVERDVPYGFHFEMDVEMAGRIRSITSPSHPIEIGPDGARAHVRLAQRTAPMDRDLVVVIAAEGMDAPHALVEKGERGGGVLLSFVPAFESKLQPADVVFVIDRSGSMAGTSILEVRNALQLCLRSLVPGCRFNIVSFGDSHSALFPESRPYDEASMSEASALVASLDADMGGTEMRPALEFVLGHAAAAGLAKQVLLLTDGEVTNTDEIIDLAGRHAASARFFTFGIGAGASHHLLRGIARASGGAAEFIAPGERIEAKVMRQFKRVLAPALAEVSVDWGQRDTLPSADVVPPVFNGERLTIYALGTPSAPATATLSATLAGRPVRFALALDPAAALSGDTITTLAARTRIRTLEERGEYLESRGSRQRRARSRAADAAAEIAALGVKYQLCSRETSFVAIEHREAPLTDRAELRRVPVALTSGWGGVETQVCQSPPTRVQSVSFLAALPSAPARSRGGDAFMEFDASCEMSDSAAGPWAPPPPDSSAPCYLRRSEEPPRHARREHDALVEQQAADGSWDLTPGLAQAVGSEIDQLMRALGNAAPADDVSRRALATALAVTWLRTRAWDARAEWEMLADKALAWLGLHVDGERWLRVAGVLLEN
jgi:Ca-activated chloride channel homolog